MNDVVPLLRRAKSGFAENLAGGEWIYSDFKDVTDLEVFSADIKELKSGHVYEYRAVVRHPKIEIKGEIKRFTAP